MRRFSTIVIIALSTLLFVSICSAQHESKTPSTLPAFSVSESAQLNSANSVRSDVRRLDSGRRDSTGWFSTSSPMVRFRDLGRLELAVYGTDKSGANNDIPDGHVQRWTHNLG